MMAGMGVISNARNLILDVNPALEASMVALAVGILSIGSACGRVFTGFLNDYYGTKTNIRVSAFCVFLSTLLAALAITTQSYVFLVIAFICTGFSTGMSAPDGAVVTRKLFGDKHYQVNFEVVMSCGVLNAFASAFVGGLYDLSGAYILPMFVLAGFGFIGFICSCLIRKP
jgi:MFS family permease